MLNVSCVTSSSFKTRRNYEIIKEKHQQIFSEFKTSDVNFYNFSEIILKNIPLNFIEILTDQDIIEFSKYLYSTLDNRKKKKFNIDVVHALNTNFFIGNFSIITLATDDRPFLVDSIREYFYEINFNQRFIIHPILNVKRGHSGKISHLEKPGFGTSNESLVVIFMEDVDENTLKNIKKELESIYSEVILAVDDFNVMTTLLHNLSEVYKNTSPDTSEFINWLMNDNFIFQGIRVLNDISLDSDNDENYSMEQFGVYKLNRSVKIIPSLIKAIKNKTLNFIDDYPVVVDKALFKSKIKKRKKYDRLMFFDFQGNKCNVITVLGIFSKNVTKTPPHNISITRNKIAKVFDNFKFVHGSHDYKWARDVIDVFPKTEIFNFNAETISEIIEVILSLQGKNQIKIYWKDFAPLKNFYCFLALPIEKFSVELVTEIGEILSQILSGKILDISVREDEHGYAYVHYNLYLKDVSYAKELSESTLSEKIVPLLKEWEDDLYDILKLKHTPHETDQLFNNFKSAFSDNYKTRTSPKEASIDIKLLSELKDVSSYLYADEDKTIIKIYSKKMILLTDIIPIIDNMGLEVNEENIYKIKTNSDTYYINSIYIANVEDYNEFKTKYKNILTDLVVEVIQGNIENDKLNKLLISTELDYRKIDLLRAIRNYIEQIEHTFRRATLNDTLNNQNHISKKLVELFDTRLNPKIKKSEEKAITEEIFSMIEGVKSVAEDSILRHFVKVIKNIIRTNFYMLPTKSYISFKIDSKKLDLLPDPKPLYEIYVHSAKMEGIHLRGGKVARGGLRFSDRPDDFRTEILGLVKTQIVKNTVIVPTGSKGGFVVKNRLADRDADKLHVIEQYKTFIKGLLDITDNYVGKRVVHPNNVKILDGKDPYLVVAADKGTATFSDIANSVSREYGFWLDDAFASGGSVGYDHKKVGITAMGAWESVKRHFREMGKNIQKEDFTVIGIGDMSGDVFGNGMLLSKHIRLLAAFNHIHIFLDPNPDAAASYAERKRLFKKVPSTWKDYNTDLISKGGGVFDRSSKKIILSPEIKQMLDTNLDFCNGEELINLILKMKAELLWNGGIGTYVKNVNETNEDVGDTANDHVRVNANELNIKVVGEGGNLGFTQKARITFAMRGGKIYTDALDNSAGVDMSDHEVNLKIMADHLLKNKVIPSMKERNKFVLSLTNEVTDLVLRDNYLQSQTVSCDHIRANKNCVAFVETANFLKDIGLLDFKIEELNFIKEDRKPTTPELAVLMAYIKIFLLEEIEDSINLDNPIVQDLYTKYYPQTLLNKYGEHIDEHKLKKEIAITVLVNKVINQAGTTFFMELFKNTGKDFYSIIEKYIFAERILGCENLRAKIEELDGKVHSEIQYHMLIEIEKTLKVAVEWLISNDANTELLENNMPLFEEISSLVPVNLKNHLKDNYKKLMNYYTEGKAPKKLAKQICDFRYSKPAFDMFEMAYKNKFNPAQTIKTYIEVGSHLEFHNIITGIKNIKVKTPWDRINAENLMKRTKELQKKLTLKILQNNNNWLNELEKRETAFFNGYRDFLKSIKKNEIDTMVPYNVMLDSFFNLSKRY
jgi:glutamate dehydrogenase